VHLEVGDSRLFTDEREDRCPPDIGTTSA